MSEKFIPIFEKTPPSKIWDFPPHLPQPSGQLFDRLHRPLKDLRISVTDRCNFRCTYCMPKAVFDAQFQSLPHSSLLSFEEIVRIAKAFIAHGVTKIRLTGGEPLLRKNIEELIRMLSQLRCLNGEPLDLTLTTNGALLGRKAQALKEAGLNRITVSLDALDDTVFKQMNDVDFPVSEVLDGIKQAQAVGFKSLKINMVVKAGVNEQEIVAMARYFKQTPHTLRFIEFMDVGSSNGWRMDDVISSAEIRQRLASAGLPVSPLTAHNVNDTASRWCYADGGEVGFISSVTQAFCHDCSRARISTEGKLYTCLFASEGHDLRALLREQHDLAGQQARIEYAIARVWQQRTDRYSELRGSAQTAAKAKIEMSYIGG
ncbi:MAG: GTP 3',8-cyclase MoaA [Burkholderiales bacterium]|nr:GTP 3',8-cyclase MoaA [Burkholderiales bacterium]